MKHSSPLCKDWKNKPTSIATPLEKFKTIKPVIPSKVGRKLVDKPCGVQELFWIERWLENLVRSRGLPPSCMGENAYSALMRMLEPNDFNATIELLQKQFLMEHPSLSPLLEVPLMEDFSYLLKEFEVYPELQSQSLLSAHSNLK